MANFKHGMRKTKLFGIWSSMISRCTNKNDAAFENYGGRGISVCDRWLEFANFFGDMGSPPPGLTLDRIKNDQGYSKENCRWATRSQQGRNKRNNRILVVDGESKSMAEWADISGIKLQTIWARLRKGWDDKSAVRTPVITTRPSVKLKRGDTLRNTSFGAEHGVDFNQR